MLCWADKVGVLWAFLVFAFFFAIAGDRAALLGWPALHDLAILIVPVWLAFRLIDWISGGPARRRGQVRARVIR